MSVAAGRAFLAVAGALLAGCAVWFGIAASTVGVRAPVAVVLEGLVLPARTAVPAVSRVVIRLRDENVVAFTPRDGRLSGELRGHGVAVTVDPEPLSPARAARRHHGSVGLGELVAGALPWAAIAVGAAVILWVVVEAVSG